MYIYILTLHITLYDISYNYYVIMYYIYLYMMINVMLRKSSATVRDYLKVIKVYQQPSGAVGL